MIRAREVRVALTGALLFLAAGMLQACAADALSGPEEEPKTEVTEPPLGETCQWVMGQYVCR